MNVTSGGKRQCLHAVRRALNVCIAALRSAIRSRDITKQNTNMPFAPVIRALTRSCNFALLNTSSIRTILNVELLEAKIMNHNDDCNNSRLHPTADRCIYLLTPKS